MMKKQLSMVKYVRWLIAALLLAVLYSGLGHYQVTLANGYYPPKTPTPTATFTPTATPTRPIEACQVTAVIFDQESYTQGETMAITVRVVDAIGNPLAGAKVVADVTRRDFDNIATQAATGFGLIDRTGDYDGAYDQTETPGFYDFKFTVSDPVGGRFLPCMGQVTKRVEEESPICTISPVEFDHPDRMYLVDESVNLTATLIGTNGAPANVTTLVTRPDGSQDGPFNLPGNNPYFLTYDNTSVLGKYTFNLTATDPTGENFASCKIDEPIIVKPPPCEFTQIMFDKARYMVGDTINLTTALTGTNGADANVTAVVTRPDDGQEGPFNFTGDNPYSLGYNNTSISGYYTFNLTATDPTGENFASCSPDEVVSVPVDEIPERALVRVEPDNIETTLCSLQETVAINVAEVTNLLSVELEIAYDPTVIQVIDGDAGQRGVQVRVGNIFATGNITRNEVDTRNGRIYFTATRLSGYTQSIPDGLIAIDWRPQRVGHSDITLVRAVLTDTNGQEIPAEINDGGITVNFVPNCNVAGAVSLQGRTDFTNVIVTNSAGAQTQTAADGSFVLKADQVLTFKFPGYLSTEIDLSDPVEIVEADGQTVQVDDIDLLAGDVNGDDEINVLDLVQIAASISTANNVADLNGDGQVDILDLVTAAGNFQQAGPVAAWQ